MRAELSEAKEDSKTLFMYKDIKSDNWEKLELKKEGELTYTGNLILLYNNDYEYKIVVKGDKTQSGDIEELYKDQFIPTMPDVSWSYNEEGIYFHVNDEVDFDGEQTYHENKVKSIELILNNNKEKTYKCEYKEESSYNDSDEEEERFEYYEVNIPKKDYGDKVNSIKMKVTYESGISYIEEEIDSQCE